MDFSGSLEGSQASEASITKLYHWRRSGLCDLEAFKTRRPQQADKDRAVLCSQIHSPSRFPISPDQTLSLYISSLSSYHRLLASFLNQQRPRSPFLSLSLGSLVIGSQKNGAQRRCFPTHWEDLFSPPASRFPGLLSFLLSSMSISCLKIWLNFAQFPAVFAVLDCGSLWDSTWVGCGPSWKGGILMRIMEIFVGVYCKFFVFLLLGLLSYLEIIGFPSLLRYLIKRWNLGGDCERKTWGNLFLSSYSIREVKFPAFIRG